MRVRTVAGVVGAVVLFLVAAGCSSTQWEAVEGVLPDGTVFALTSAETSPLEAMSDGLVIIDVRGRQAQVIGVHRYERVADSNMPPRTGAVVLRTESWILAIDLYPDVQALLEQNGWKIQDLLAVREVRGLPVLTLEAPLRLAVANETPRQVEVTYGLLAVRHGCDDSRALVCSDDRKLQVIPIDLAADNVPGLRIENR